MRERASNSLVAEDGVRTRLVRSDGGADAGEAARIDGGGECRRGRHLLVTLLTLLTLLDTLHDGGERKREVNSGLGVGWEMV